MAERHQTLSRAGREGTVFPIPPDWRSPFIGASNEECAAFLNDLEPAPTHAQEEDAVDLIDYWAFAVLDSKYQRNGELTVCRRRFELENGDEAFVSLKCEAMAAPLLLIAASDSQWYDRLESARSLAARRQAVDYDDETVKARRKEAKAKMQEELG